MTKRCIALVVLCVMLTYGAQNAHAASPRSFVSGQQIAQTALSYRGYNYSLYGNTPWTGFSCIGLVHWVYSRWGLYVPSFLAGAWNAFPHVGRWNLVPGDVVFFANTEWAGLSHAAIYIGGGQVVAADSFATGVRVDNLSDGYWSSHYLGAVRPLAG